MSKVFLLSDKQQSLPGDKINDQTPIRYTILFPTPNYVSFKIHLIFRSNLRWIPEFQMGTIFLLLFFIFLFFYFVIFNFYLFIYFFFFEIQKLDGTHTFCFKIVMGGGM